MNKRDSNNHATGLHNRRDFLKKASLGAAALAMPVAARAASGSGKRPNIVLIMADDMGYSDIGCYGGEIRTPNLDKLAKGGVRFTQFYNTARCCPTRASLMTGLYAHQAGIGHMMEDKGVDGYRGDLNRSCVTIAEALKGAGYATFMSGKWHVTPHTKPQGPKHNWPRQRGFDRFFGTISGAGSFYTPASLTRDNTQVTSYPKDFFYTDAINDNASQFVADHIKAKNNAPFFLYVAHTAPHWPLHARPEDIARYRGKYMKGWDAVRKERHARMIAMGLVDEKWPLTPRDVAAKKWSEVDEAQKDNMDLKMAIYAAQVDRLDQGVGRLVETLKKTDALDNTLIFFLADNGGCAEGGIWGFDRNKSKPGRVLGENSSFASYGLSWANASNTPFRRYKHWVHEGGISSPLIVHWPDRVKSRGEFRSQPGHVIDIMASCLDAAGAEYPKTYKGNVIKPLEGKSLLPAFDNHPVEREAIFWEHEGHRAVRRGKWKVVSKHPGEWELYDLEADRTELRDLTEKEPEIAREMIAMHAAWAKRCGVQPWPVGGAKKKKNVGSKKKKFNLKQGDSLTQEKSPRAANRAIQILATLSAPTEGETRGVVVAQGGSSHGYALYVQDGRLAFATRHSGEQTVVTSKRKISKRKIEVRACLGKDGLITIEMDGARVASGKASGPLSEMPIDGLEVGADIGGAVGGYATPNKFNGEIRLLTLKLND